MKDLVKVKEVKKRGMKRMIEARLQSPSDVIELEAFGLTNGMDKSRPVILFREKGGEAVLPVWLSPLDAGIAITQGNGQIMTSSPHEVSLVALKQLGVKLQECHFRELKGHQQYVELMFTGSKRLKAMNMRADHVISFCLQAKARFFCTRGYVQKCRDIESEISQAQVYVGVKGTGSRPRTEYLN